MFKEENIVFKRGTRIVEQGKKIKDIIKSRIEERIVLLFILIGRRRHINYIKTHIELLAAKHPQSLKS